MSNQSIITSIVSISNSSSIIKGMGFLVSKKHVLTCAHVITEVLNITERKTTLPIGKVYIDFPLLTNKKICTGQVSFWRSESESTSRGSDIALLELKEDPPNSSQPGHLVIEDDLWGHKFRTFGFPGGCSHGVWASGVIRDKLANGWIEIEDIKTTGYFVAPGFSGAPVWDERISGIVGMIVAAEEYSDIRAAFIIPTRVLIETVTILKKKLYNVDQLFLGENKSKNQKLTKKIILNLKGHPYETQCTFDKQAIVGRSSACDFSLCRASAKVSNWHARIYYRAKTNGYYIQDLDSTNGTYVDGKRIERVTQLHMGSRIRLGTTLTFIFDYQVNDPLSIGILIYHSSDVKELARYIVVPKEKVKIGNAPEESIKLPFWESGCSLGCIIKKADGLYYSNDNKGQLRTNFKLENNLEFKLASFTIKVTIPK